MDTHVVEPFAVSEPFHMLKFKGKVDSHINGGVCRLT
jgi:hypothetical protein